jgi:hypothetical protein
MVTRHQQFSGLDARTGKGVERHEARSFHRHAHACSLYSLARLLGVEFIEDGIRLGPGLPLESYSFESPLLGVRKSKMGYEGWYAPAAAGEWTVHVTLPESGAGQRMYAEINGKRSRVAVQAGGVTQLRGSSGPGKPLRWSLRR